MLKAYPISFIIFIILKISFGKNEFNLLSEPEDFEEINIEQEIEQEYVIKGNTSYIFTIVNEDYLYSFTALVENIFYIKKQDETFEVKPNETFFEKRDKIYVNPLKNLNDTKIKISPYHIYYELNSFETINKNQYFFIKTENKSIAYFDSFDKNSKIYLSESRQKPVLKEDIRINGNLEKLNQIQFIS